MEKITITKVSATDTSKAGVKLINKFGKPYYKVGLKTNEYGDTWINGLMPFNPDKWEGSTQEVEVYDEEYQGTTYKKFRLPPRAGGMSEGEKADIQSAKRDATAALWEVKALKQTLTEQGILKTVIPGTTVQYPQGNPNTAFNDQPDEIKPEDIPF